MVSKMRVGAAVLRVDRSEHTYTADSSGHFCRRRNRSAFRHGPLPLPSRVSHIVGSTPTTSWRHRSIHPAPRSPSFPTPVPLT